MRKNLFAFAVTMVMSVAAHAQWAVIDAANLKQNIVNTMSTYTQEISAASRLLNQYKQLENEYLQLKSLSNGTTSNLLGTVQTALGNQQRYLNSVTGMYGDLNNARAVVDGLSNEMAASGLSQEQWMARETARNQANQQGNGFLADYQANVLNQVGKRYQEVQSLQGQITSTEGTHQSLQLLNSQMNVLLSSMNQLIEQNAVMAQRMAAKDAVETGRETAQTTEYSTFVGDYKANREKVVKQIEGIGAKK